MSKAELSLVRRKAYQAEYHGKATWASLVLALLTWASLTWASLTWALLTWALLR